MPHLIGLQLHSDGIAVAALRPDQTIVLRPVHDMASVIQRTSARRWKWSIGVEGREAAAVACARELFLGLQHAMGDDHILAGIAVPATWNDRARRALLLATEGTSVEAMRLVRDTTALAVAAVLLDPSISGLCAFAHVGTHKLELTLAEVSPGTVRVRARQSVPGLDGANVRFESLLPLITEVGNAAAREAGVAAGDIRRFICNGQRVANPALGNALGAVWGIAAEVFPGGTIALGAAHVAVGLTGMAAPWNLLDDLDESPLAAFRGKPQSTVRPPPSAVVPVRPRERFDLDDAGESPAVEPLHATVPPVHASRPSDRPPPPAYRPPAPVYRPSAPVHGPSAPVHRPSAPAHRPSAPAQPSYVPAQPPIAPARRPSAPVQPSFVPAQPPIAPARHPSAPVQPSFVPSQPPMTPAQPPMTPAQRPSGSAHHPSGSPLHESVAPRSTAPEPPASRPPATSSAPPAPYERVPTASGHTGDHPSFAPPSGQVAEVGPAGSFVGLPTLDAVCALHLLHPAEPEGLRRPVLATLLNQFTFLRTVSGTLTLRHLTEEVVLHVEYGGVCLTAPERTRALRAFEWPEGTFTWQKEKLPWQMQKHRAPMTGFIAAGLRTRLRGFEDSVFAQAHQAKLRLAPSVIDERRTRIARLALPEAEDRAVDHVLDGTRTFEMMLGEGYIGRTTLHRLVVLLDLYGILQWVQPATASAESPAAVMTRLLAKIEAANHFVALDVHWSAPVDEIRQAWEKAQGMYGPAGNWQRHDPALAARILQRMAAAWAVLRVDATRVQHRREAYPGMDEQLLAPLVEARAKALEMRGEKSEAERMMRLRGEFQVGAEESPSWRPKR